MLTITVIILATLVVLATSLLKQVEWSVKTKNLIATVLSVVAAVVVTVFAKDVDLTPENLFELAIGIYGLSQLIYNFIFRGTTVEAKVAAVGSNNGV